MINLPLIHKFTLVTLTITKYILIKLTIYKITQNNLLIQPSFKGPYLTKIILLLLPIKKELIKKHLIVIKLCNLNKLCNLVDQVNK
jgi:hypothetical protein